MFGSTRSLLLRSGFLQLQLAVATLQLWCVAFSLWWFLLLQEHRLQSMGSVVVAFGEQLSCSSACGIFPYQGSNLCPLHWQMNSYSPHYEVSPKVFIFILPADIQQFQNFLFLFFEKRKISPLNYLCNFIGMRCPYFCGSMSRHTFLFHCLDTLFCFIDFSVFTPILFCVDTLYFTISLETRLRQFSNLFLLLQSWFDSYRSFKYI